MSSHGRAVLLATALWSALGSTQSLPTCATACYDNALSGVSCPPKDPACVCSEANLPTFRSLFGNCAFLACESDLVAVETLIEIEDTYCLGYSGIPSVTAPSLLFPTSISSLDATSLINSIEGVLTSIGTPDVSAYVSSVEAILMSEFGIANSITTHGSTTLFTPSTTLLPTAAPGTTQPTPSGLSSKAKAGIGIGSTLGGLSIIGLIIFVIWFNKRGSTSAASSSTSFFFWKKPTPNPDALPTYTPKPDGVVVVAHEIEDTQRPLGESDKVELEWRRRTAELAGGGAVNPKDWEDVGERVELEARRRMQGEIFELS